MASCGAALLLRWYHWLVGALLCAASHTPQARCWCTLHGNSYIGLLLVGGSLVGSM
jgi:hypothetical protein